MSNRDALANSMCRHSLISDWYEKADLVLADLEVDHTDPLFKGTAADVEAWLGEQSTVDLVMLRIVVYEDGNDPAGVVATGDNPT